VVRTGDEELVLTVWFYVGGKGERNKRIMRGQPDWAWKGGGRALSRFPRQLRNGCYFC